MFKLLPFALLLVLAGCVSIPPSVPNVVTPREAFELQGAVNELALASGVYARLPRCSKHPAPCSSQAVVGKLRVYVNTAENATHSLTAWTLAHPTLNAASLYAAALAAYNTAENFWNANKG